MNKTKLGTITSIIAITLLLSLTGMVLAQEDSTDSAQIDPAINESIKERIRKVATQSASMIPEKRKIAFIGNVEKIANNTLTIKTKDEIKLASTSAQTTFVKSSGSKVEISDIAIDQYIAALGYVNGSQVLETKRVILYDEKPESTKKSSVAGYISLVDEEEDQITLSIGGEDMIFTITSKTDITIQQTNSQSDLKFVDLKENQFISIIYLSTEDELTTPKALSILATTVMRDKPMLEEYAQEASESASTDDSPLPTNPPELGN